MLGPAFYALEQFTPEFPAKASNKYPEPQQINEEKPVLRDNATFAAENATNPTLDVESAAKQKQSLLHEVLSQPITDSGLDASILEQFFSAETTAETLKCWLGEDFSDLSKEEIALRLNRDVSHIDLLITNQVNAILHHPNFQKLEASWRGLKYLVDSAYFEGLPDIKIKMMSVSWREVERDLERAPEFDQSQLFKRIYDDEFGHPGGEPFGLLIGDYEIHPRPSREHPHDDIATLTRLSGVAAAAFCPFIASAAPAMFGMDSYTDLEHINDLERGFQLKEFIPWKQFRQTEDSRFIGLALPRTLMRLPHEASPQRSDDFCFAEDVTGIDSSKYLWGNAAFAFGAVTIRAYAQCGWFADIRGVRRGIDGGGLVTGLPSHSFGSDRMGIAIKSSTEAVIAETQESEFANLGFIPLCDCKDTAFSAFHSNQSTQKPKKYDRPAATRNAQISSMLQYTLCVSRFAHYLKVLARDKIGMYTDADECQRTLERWIMNYVTPDSHATPQTRAKRPLREAKVTVEIDPSDPSRYHCLMHLAPHYQLDDVTALLRFYTTINKEGVHR